MYSIRMSRLATNLNEIVKYIMQRYSMPETLTEFYFSGIIVGILMLVVRLIALLINVLLQLSGYILLWLGATTLVILISPILFV